MPYRYAAKIAEARTAKGWSQARLAKEIGTTQQQIARYESGANDVKSSVMLRLSKALGVTLSYLLGVDDLKDENGVYDARLDEIQRTYREVSEPGRAMMLENARSVRRLFPPADAGCGRQEEVGA